MEGSIRAQAATGEIKSGTAATVEDMYERAEFGQQLGGVICMVDLVIDYTAFQSKEIWICQTEMILHFHRASNSTYSRQNIHGTNFRVVCKWIRVSGIDHSHAGTVVGKQEAS